MTQPVNGVGARPYAPRFVQTPQSELARVVRTVPRLGAAAAVLAVVSFLASVILPYLVIPDEAGTEIWLLFAGIVTSASACGAAGSVLSTRRAVRDGYLDLWVARSARAGLGGACVVSTVGAAAAIVLLAGIVSAPATWYKPAVEFGALSGVYIGALVVAVAVNYTCFFRMRPLLWRAQHVLRYRGCRISASEKRR